MPPSRNRRSRSTRAATQRSTATSSSRRGRGGRSGSAAARTSRLVEQNTRNARKWIQVSRPPCEGIKFAIPTWVPIDKLTADELETYNKLHPKDQPEDNGGKEQDPSTNSTEPSTTTTATPNNNKVADNPLAAEGQTEIQPAAAAAADVPDNTLASAAQDEQTSEPPTKRARIEGPEGAETYHNNNIATNTTPNEEIMEMSSVRFDFSEPETQLFLAETQGETGEQSNSNETVEGGTNDEEQQPQHSKGAVEGETCQSNKLAEPVEYEQQEQQQQQQQQQQSEESGAAEGELAGENKDHTEAAEQQPSQENTEVVGTSENAEEAMEIETTI